MTLRVHPDEIVQSSKSPLLAKHESWERVRLGVVAEVLNGFAFKSTQFGHDGGIPLLRIRDVGSATTQIRYAGDYDPRYVVNPGSIVVGMDGDFRAARWSGPPALLNQRVCTVTVRYQSFYDEAFLLYALPGYLDAIHSWTSSITVKHLSSETIKEIPLPLPPLAEQRRIVAAIEEQLSRLDAATASLDDASDRMRALSDGLLIFRNGATPVPLDDLTVHARYGTSTKCAYEADGPPVLRIPNIRDRRVDTQDLKRAVDPAADVGAVEDGDLLFIRTNGSRDLIGRVAVVGSDEVGLGFASYLIRVRLDRARVDPAFAALALSTRQVRDEIEMRAASTAGQYNLNLRAIAGLSIPLPPFPEQRRVREQIETQLARVDRIASEVAAAKARADSLRRAILARAFRGDLVPHDPNDEPASVLLERIAAERARTEAETGRRPRRGATMEAS